jgi:hypothetical protein
MDIDEEPEKHCWVKRCQQEIVSYKANKHVQGNVLFACQKHSDNSFTFSFEIPKLDINLIYSQYNCYFTRRELITIIDELKKENLELKQWIQNYELNTLMKGFTLK